MKRTLVTSALPYANGYIHLGHCAGAYLPADIYVRFLRLNAENVLYVCGSDEHGVAITIAAQKEKVTPQEIIDKYHYANSAAFDGFGMSFDIYSRTSIPEHHEIAREFFGDFQKKGLLNSKEIEQYYDEKAKMFLPDRYVEGICPNCGNERARGDQCDSCGAYYSQTELKNPKSLVSGDSPILKKTTHWFFKFGELQDFLEQYIESHSGDWKDNVLQQTRSWLKAGMAERAITRDLNWGVSIDGIEGIDEEAAKGKVLYVWFDAVLGYISATKKYFGGDDRWKEWWQNPDTDYLAFIGKDNIVFHTLIFPAMLQSRKDEGNPYILPKNVPAHEFLNLEGQKFSKSRNWSIDLKDFLVQFPKPNQIDALRYTLAMNFPETRDSDFTWKDYQTRNNNELAAILGNFVNRALQFLHKNYEGKVPVLSGKYANLAEDWQSLVADLKAGNSSESLLNKYSNLDANDFTFIMALNNGMEEVANAFKKFRFRDAITEIMNIARAANKYFNDEEPWKSIKNDADKASKSLYVCSQIVSSLSIAIAPILPFTSTYIQSLLPTKLSNGAKLEDKNYWEIALTPILNAGDEIAMPQIIFEKIEDETVNAEIAKLGEQSQAQKAEKEGEELIDIADFMKVKLRTANIIAAQRVAKSKKLLKLQVDLGDEKRQVIAGIGEQYQPEELVGKSVVIVANLKPAKLMGEVSQGMILAASADGSGLSVLSPIAEMPAGAIVK